MDKLGLNIPSLLWQIVAFLLLIALFWKYGLEPVTRILDERQRRIAESVENAERLKQEMVAGEQRQRAEIEKARREAQEILTQAKQMADKMVSDARDLARQEQERLTLKAQNEIQEEKQRAIVDLRRQVGEIAIMAAGKIVRSSLDTPTQYKLIDEVLANSALFAGNAASNGGSASPITTPGGL